MAAWPIGRVSRYTCPADATANTATQTNDARSRRPPGIPPDRLLFDRVAAVGCFLPAVRGVTGRACPADRFHRHVGIGPVPASRCGFESHRGVLRALCQTGGIVRVALGPI